MHTTLFKIFCFTTVFKLLVTCAFMLYELDETLQCITTLFVAPLIL
jgi:hypothetical protein